MVCVRGYYCMGCMCTRYIVYGCMGAVCGRFGYGVAEVYVEFGLYRFVVYEVYGVHECMEGYSRGMDGMWVLVINEATIVF